MPSTPLSRRHALLTLGGAALGLSALSACGSGSGSGGSDDGAADEDLLPAAEGTTEYPLTLESPWGSTTLEKRPERIAVITATDAEFLSMLKVTPAFAPDDYNTEAWSTDTFPTPALTVKEVEWGDPPAEAIAAARPDLIVVFASADESVYAKLKGVAPVVTLSGADGTPDPDEDWTDQMAALATALDLQAAGKKAVEDQQAAIAEVREAHPEFEGKSLSYTVFYGGDTGLLIMNTPDEICSKTFEALGFVNNPDTERFGTESKVSNELLPLIDTDVLLISDNSGGDGEPSTLGTVTDLQLFQDLAVSRAGHVLMIENTGDGFVVDGTEHEGNIAWGLAHAGPLAQVWAVNQLAPLLTDLLAR